MNYLWDELGKTKKPFISFVLIFLAVFSFLLFYGSPTLSAKIFLSVKNFLVPGNVPIISLDPVTSFFAPILFSFLAAFLISFPFGMYLIIKFLWPALRSGERKIVLVFSVLSLILFYLGCALAYFVIIPQTFKILYSFAAPMEVESYFSLNNFILSVFFVTVSTGLAFLLPVFMVLSSRIGLISGNFWMSRLRGAILFVVIFSAIVTPDGSGITMIFLAVPLIVLYLGGAFLAASIWSKRAAP